MAIPSDGPPAPPIVSAILFRAGLGGDDGIGKGLHVRGHNHYLPDGTHADALYSALRLTFAQRQMQNAAFPAVHGAEVEGHAGLLHPLGRRQRRFIRNSSMRRTR